MDQDVFQYFSHPKYQEILQYGVNEKRARVTFQIYLDLVEGKGWWNVDIEHAAALGMLFVSGHETQDHDMSIVLPCHADEPLTCHQLQSCLKVVKEEFHSESVLLAFTELDSTIVYYQMASGLVPPERPEELEAKKEKRFRYQQRRKQHHIKFRDVFQAMEAKAALSNENRAGACVAGTTVKEPNVQGQKQTVKGNAEAQASHKQNSAKELDEQLVTPGQSRDLT